MEMCSPTIIKNHFAIQKINNIHKNFIIKKISFKRNI